MSDASAGPPKYFLVKASTGEIVTRIRDGERFFKLQGRKRAKQNFVKMNLRAIGKDGVRFSGAELSLLFCLLEFLPYGSCVLKKAGRPLEVADIIGVCSLSKRTVFRGLKGLEEKGAIARVRDGRKVRLLVNPRYFSRGRPSLVADIALEEEESRWRRKAKGKGTSR